MGLRTIPFNQYQQLPPDQRSRPLTDEEFSALTPEELEATGFAEPREGAPADFGGRVLPNPNHIEPHLDTDPIAPVTRLPVGVSFHKQNFTGEPQMDVSNPAATDVIPAAGRTVAAQMTATPAHGPWEKYAKPAATTDTTAAAAAPGPWTKYAKTPTPTPVPPKAPPKKAAAPDRFAQDKAITDAFAENHPILGPIARALVTGGQSAANAITETPGQIYHAIADPVKNDEIGLTPEQRLIYRMGGKQAIEAGQDYATGKVTPAGAASVLPEALATGVGTVAGGAVYGKGGEIAGDVIAPAAKAIAENPKAIATAPIRLAARSAETALNQKLVPLKKIANINTPADLAESIDVKVPGRDLGLKPIPKPPARIGAELDATAENKPFAGGLDEYVPKREKILDATGENRPFAGGLDEPPAPKPAKTTTPKAAPAAKIEPVPAAIAQPPVSPIEAATAPIETPAPKTAPAPAAAAIPKTADPILDRLRANAAKIETAEKTAARVPEAGEDLEELGKQSVAEVNARKNQVQTTVAPKDLLDRWGVDEKSFTEGREQTRGLKPEESAKAIAELEKAYAKGKRVQPVVEVRDADNNIVEVDGRSRALAAHRAGVERIPIIVRRLPAGAATQ